MYIVLYHFCIHIPLHILFHILHQMFWYPSPLTISATMPL
jgi:hypothetical protein